MIPALRQALGRGFFKGEIARQVAVPEEERVHAVGKPGDPDGIVGEFPGPLFRGEQHADRAVGNGVRVKLPDGIAQHGGSLHLPLGNRFPGVGVGVLGGPLAAPRHYAGKMVLGEAALVHVGARLEARRIEIVQAGGTAVKRIETAVGDHVAAFTLRFLAMAHDEDQVLVARKDDGIGIANGIEALLRHLLLGQVLAPDNVLDAVVRNGPGIEEIVGCADDHFNAVFPVRETCLSLKFLQHVEKHVLKSPVPEVRFVLVLGNCTDSYPFCCHKPSPSLIRFIIAVSLPPCFLIRRFGSPSSPLRLGAGPCLPQSSL